jgi:hypothetical protein
MSELVLVRYTEAEPSLPAVEGASSAALFEVLQGGPGRYLALLETDDGADVEGAVGEEGAVERYAPLFAAPDARPVGESSRYVFAIRIQVADELDHDAFNEWYNGTHVPEVAPAGLRRGKRYTSRLPEWPYLALYDMDARDTLESEALAKVRGFYQFTPQVLTLERTVLERIAPPL